MSTFLFEREILVSMSSEKKKAILYVLEFLSYDANPVY